ncbi:MAG: sensor histidine kinase [Chitinophagaceae bacterium]
MEVPVKDIINIIITATLFVVILAGFIIMLVKLFDKARKNFALQKENIHKEFETQLLKAQLEIQEQTLQDVSQELHDNIGQELTLVKLTINTIDISRLDETQNKLDESKKLISKTIQDLRNLSKTLNTGFITEEGLPSSLEYQMAFLQKIDVYQTNLHINGDVYKNQPFVEIVLFRVVQELMNNIIKHAEASCITIELDYQDAQLIIRVVDNGKGFAHSSDVPLINGKGLGLGNIRNRIAMIKGKFILNSAPNGGTEAIIEVPRQEISTS